MAMLSADGINSEFYDNVQNEDIDTDNMHLIGKMLITRSMGTKDPAGNLAVYITFVTAGIIGSAILGMILLLADLIISKKFAHNKNTGKIPQLLIVMITSGLIVTTLNTIVLRETILEAWKLLPFTVVWLPRVIEEILSNTVMAYFVAFLLGIISKEPNINELTMKKSR